MLLPLLPAPPRELFPAKFRGSEFVRLGLGFKDQGYVGLGNRLL